MATLFFKRDLAHSYVSKYKKYDVYAVYDLLRVLRVSKQRTEEVGLTACIFGNVGCVKYLVSMGFCSFNKGLAYAAYHGRDDVVKLMIEHGATKLKTALYEALRRCQWNTAKLLIWHGADCYNNVLSFGCQCEIVNIIEWSISHGANHCWTCFGVEHPALPKN